MIPKMLASIGQELTISTSPSSGSGSCGISPYGTGVRLLAGDEARAVTGSAVDPTIAEGTVVGKLGSAEDEEEGRRGADSAGL